MNYFERYQAGEHEAVWSELRSLGPAMFEGTHLDDARLVAAAAADRAASNLERIAEGLKALGYEFVSVGPAITDAGSINAAVQASAAEALLSHPGISREQAEEMLRSMPQLLGGLSGASFSSAPAGPSVKVRSTPFGNPSQIEREIEAFEQVVGPVPLSICAFWHRLGSTDFACRDANGELLLSWEPLAVLPPMGLLDDYSTWRYEGEGAPFRVDLIPGTNLSEPPLGADLIAGADSRLQTGEWFVDHLRRAIRSACFLRPMGVLPPQVQVIADGYEPF